MTTRINKFIAESGECSRRQADKLIEEGKVTINGKLAKIGDQVSDDDIVQVGGKKQNVKQEKKYFAFHKPYGVITTLNREAYKSIADYLPTKDRLFPVGRLDVKSSGLLILTNDGNLAHELTHAKFGHEKEYVVDVDKNISGVFLKNMRNGVKIGQHTTEPAKLKKLDDKQFSIILTEGRNRQIRLMCSTLDFKVNRLKRVRIGRIMLGKLAPGKLRPLTSQEVQGLKNSGS